MSMGERLREERERMGRTQTGFGTLGGVSRKTQYAYEMGVRYPDGAYLEAIAMAGANVQYVLTGERRAPESLRVEEQLLLDRYRASPPALRDAAQRVLEGAPPGQTFQGPVGNVVAGDAGVVRARVTVKGPRKAAK